MNHPGAAWYRDWAVEDLAPARHCAFRRRLDVADDEIVEPKGKRRALGVGNHAADCLRSGGELLVGARRADKSLGFSPAKQLAVESKRRF